MGIIDSGNILQGVVDTMSTQFETNFQDAFNAAPKYMDSLTQFRVTSGKNVEHVFHTAPPSMRRLVDTRLVKNIDIKSQMHKTAIFESTVKVPRNMVLSDQWGVYADDIKAMAVRAGLLPDQELARKLQRATALDPGEVTFDGVPFFSTAHVWKTGGAQQSNYFSSGKTLSATNYGIVKAALTAMVDNEGVPFQFNDFTLVVPSALEDLGKTILSTDLIINSGGTASGDNIYKGTANLVVNPFLNSEPTAWYLMAKIGPVAPLFWYTLQGADLKFVALDQPEHPNVFHNFEYLYGCDTEGVAVLGLPHQIIKAQT